MTEKTCSFWIERADYRCILSSGATTPDGSAVLEHPLSVEAAKRFSGVDSDLGKLLLSRGNHVHLIRPGLLSFPIKQYLWTGPSLPIIERSARELMEIVGTATTLLPRPGCGPNELNWDDVAKALAFLPDNIVVVASV